MLLSGTRYGVGRVIPDADEWTDRVRLDDDNEGQPQARATAEVTPSAVTLR